MNTEPHFILAGLICLLLVSVPAQEKPKKCKRATTDSKKLMGTIKINERESIGIAGKATYTIAAFNSDDSLAGTFVFALADAERQKIAQALNKQLRDIPSTISQQEVIAQFHKLTECPVLQLDFPAMELELAGAKMQLKRFTLKLKENSDSDPTMYLCVIARQIATDRGGWRRNLHRINALLNCQEKD